MAKLSRGVPSRNKLFVINSLQKCSGRYGSSVLPNLNLSSSTLIHGKKSVASSWKLLFLLGFVVGLGGLGSIQAADRIPQTKEPVQSDFIEAELRVLIRELGADAKGIPHDFREKVNRWIRLYQTRDRYEMARMLGPRRETFEAIRQKLRDANLPPELAYVTLVESHFEPNIRSSGNNAGLWQFEPTTARLNGLKVNSEIDERLDPRKSTIAACRYFLTLRRVLGSEASLLTVVAAYNLGPSRLQQRMKTLDPEQADDFWQLYSTRTIPALTRTHIARFVAAILVGRNEHYFGFAEPVKAGNLARQSSPITQPTRSQPPAKQFSQAN